MANLLGLSFRFATFTFMKKIFTILVFLYSGMSLGLNITDSVKVQNLNYKIANLKNQNKKDSLITLYKEIADIYYKNNNWEKFAHTNNSISVEYQKLIEYDKCEEFLYKNFKLINENKLDSTNQYIGTSYNILGTLFYNMGQYDKAIKYCEKCLSVYKKIDKIESKKIAVQYINLGVFYSTKKNYKKALIYHKYSLDILMQDPIPDKNYLLSTYINLGKVHRYKKEYKKAINYYKKGIELFKKERKNSHYYICKSNLAIVYQNTGNYFKTLEILNEIIRDYKNNNRKDRVFKHIGTTYYYMKEYEKALSYLNKSLELKKQRFKQKHPYLAKNNTALGDVYTALEDHSTALQYYQQSLVDLCLNFNDSTGISNPVLELISDKSELLIALRKKAATLAKMEQTAAALETYLLSIDLNETIGYQHSDLESRDFQYQETRAIYEKAMELAYRLYLENKNENYLETAFQIAERSKSSLLVQSLQDTEAHYIGGVPLDLIEKEKELTIEISFYENKLFKTKNEADKSKMEQALFHKREDLDKLIRQLEKDYPKYYEEKYSRNEIRIEDIQHQQNENQAFIQFFYGADACYIITIDKETAKIVKQERNQDLEKNIATFLSSMNSNYHFEHGEENYKNYTSAAHYLYQQLIEPINSIIKEKQLSISPDGILSYIPFEALLYEETNSMADYRKAAYLIKKHSIHYAFSAGLNYKNKQQKNNYATSFGGYAPDYGKGSLQQLHWNGEEVNNAANIFNGNAYTGDRANKAHFMTHKNESQILHLAMHANADSINPMHSRLLFGEKNDTESLYAYELCNMDISSELVVLSACETGAGQLINGEGVMSLARSFFYAGCPSVIMSQWQLDDRTSTEIMQAFYQYLNDGKNKSEALRLAKLDFIRKSGPIKANPIYWANIVAVGNPRPIKSGSTTIWYFGFLLVLPLGFYYIRKRKQKQAA